MTRHVVVDGSNLATEGRSHPSLTQLNEAVLAYMAEHPGALVTVVVDATFGHREARDVVACHELPGVPDGVCGAERLGVNDDPVGRTLDLLHLARLHIKRQVAVDDPQAPLLRGVCLSCCSCLGLRLQHL
jgi:hypothetical protein